MAFDADIPLPDLEPPIGDVVPVGDDVWIKDFAYGSGAELVTWYVLDASDRRLVGHITLPGDWTVLGGRTNSVFILRRDDLGVEYISIFNMSAELVSVSKPVGMSWPTRCATEN